MISTYSKKIDVVLFESIKCVDVRTLVSSRFCASLQILHVCMSACHHQLTAISRWKSEKVQVTVVS